MNSAILLAGGSGKRMGEGVDKLMLPVLGRPLLAYVLETFQDCDEVGEIIIVAREDRKEAYRALAAALEITKVRLVIPGGIERQDSVWCGLQALSPKSEIVLIHDAARALVTTELVARCIVEARRHGAVIPAMRVKDTIKMAQSAPGAAPVVAQTLDRSLLWAAQTPQTFRLELIRRAYEPLIHARVIVTDDAAAVEKAGHTVHLLEGDATNLKITTQEDLSLAEAVLSRRKSLQLLPK